MVMSTFRNPSKDKLKGASILKEQVRLQARCKLEDCDELLTIFDGPGSDSYCRAHQLQLTDYEGGIGRILFTENGYAKTVDMTHASIPTLMI